MQDVSCHIDVASDTDNADLPCRKATYRAPAAPIILPSTSKACSRQAALIYFPGALVDAAHYVPLSHAIQSQLETAGISLHVALTPSAQSPALKSTQDCISASLSGVEAALEALKETCGFDGPAAQLIFGGHSMGATLALHAAFSDPASSTQPPLATPRCRCILSHASYTPPPYRTLKCIQAAPIADILGDRDGVIRLSSIAPVQDEIDAIVPEPSGRARVAPVAILPGVNHASFANSQTTAYAAPRDLPATVSAAAATAAIAKASAEFIGMTDPDAPAAAVHAAASFFEHSTQHARDNYFDVYRNALARDMAGDTCRGLQEVLLGLQPCMGLPLSPRNPEDTGFSSEQVAVLQPRAWNTEPPLDPDTPSNEYDWPFLSCKPKLFVEGGTEGAGEGAEAAPPRGRVQPWPQSSLALRGAPDGWLASIPCAPTKLRCKLKSGHAVGTALASGVGAYPGGPTYSDGPASEPPAPGAAAAGPPPASGGGGGMPEGMRERQRAEAERLDPFTAARMNEHVVRSVLSALPEAVRERYERSPRRLAFGPDVHTERPPEWAASELSFVDLLEGSADKGGWQPGAGEGRVVLQSRRAATAPGETRFSGMLYCTVISEAQAFDYIMYESQKRPGVEVDAQGVLVSHPAAAVDE